MPTTSNFGWTTPADTDLVKDGAAAIRTLGNGIDTSLVDLKGGTTGQILSKNSNTDLDYIWINNDQGDITAVTAGTGLTGGGTTGAVTLTNDMATTITAAGDIVVGTGSGTYDNLPIGTTGQVLTADTTVSPYKVKWAAAATGALTKINSSSFTSVASVTVDSVFTSSYTKYLAIIKVLGTIDDDLQMQLRYSSTTLTSGVYKGAGRRQDRGNTVENYGYNNATEITIDTRLGAEDSFYYIYFDKVGNSSEKPMGYGNGYTDYAQGFVNIGFFADSSQTFTGFLLKGSSGNITGTWAVYGVQN